MHLLSEKWKCGGALTIYLQWRKTGGELFRVAVTEKVCCSVLQCVTVCCSVFQCVAACCSVIQCVIAFYSVLQRVAMCCSVF